MFGFEVTSGDMFIIAMEKVKLSTKFNVFINLTKSHLKINDLFSTCSCVVLLLNICIVPQTEQPLVRVMSERWA